MYSLDTNNSLKLVVPLPVNCFCLSQKSVPYLKKLCILKILLYTTQHLLNSFFLYVLILIRFHLEFILCVM